MIASWPILSLYLMLNDISIPGFAILVRLGCYIMNQIVPKYCLQSLWNSKLNRKLQQENGSRFGQVSVSCTWFYWIAVQLTWSSSSILFWKPLLIFGWGADRSGWLGLDGRLKAQVDLAQLDALLEREARVVQAHGVDEQQLLGQLLIAGSSSQRHWLGWAEQAENGVGHQPVASMEQHQLPDELAAQSLPAEVALTAVRRRKGSPFGLGQHLLVAATGSIFSRQEANTGADKADLGRQAHASQRAQQVESLVWGLTGEPGDHLLLARHHFRWAAAAISEAAFF